MVKIVVDTEDDFGYIDRSEHKLGEEHEGISSR